MANDGTLVFKTKIDDTGIEKGIKNIKKSVKQASEKASEISIAPTIDTKKAKKSGENLAQAVESGVETVGAPDVEVAPDTNGAKKSGEKIGEKIKDGIEDEIGGAEPAISEKLNSTLKKVATAASVVAIASKAKDVASECVAAASDVEEMQNKFDVVFDGINEDVEKWADTYAKSVGRNKNTIKGYLADNQNMFVGMGMSREAAAGLTENMSSLALDLASFNNLDETDAVNAFSKALMGETESAKQLGAVLNDNTREQAMNTLGIKGSYSELDEATKMQVNYQAILSQSSDAVGDCERSLDSYKGQQIQTKSALENIKETIGTQLLPVLSQIMKVANDFFSSEQGQQFLAGLVTAIQAIVSALSTVITFIMNNKELVLGVLAAITVAVIAYTVAQIAANIAALACPLTWIILAVIAAIAIVIAIIVLCIQYWDEIQQAAVDCWNAICDAFSAAGDWIYNNIVAPIVNWFQWLWDSICNIFSSVGKFFSDAFQGAWDGICSAFDNVKKFFENVWKNICNVFDGAKQWFSQLFMGIWNGIKNIINNWFITNLENFVNLIIDGMNALISGVDWVVSSVGSLFGQDWDVEQIQRVEIPRLATGTVVPANFGEFTAILGDNKREPEIVSPLSTMKQALKEALRESGYGAGGNAEYTFVAQLDGKTIFKEVVKQNELDKKRRGGRTILA